MQSTGFTFALGKDSTLLGRSFLISTYIIGYTYVGVGGIR